MRDFIGGYRIGLSPLVRFVVKPFLLGVGAGGALYVILVLLGSSGATRASFSIFGLLFAAATVGWSVAVTSTRSILTYAEVSNTDLDWSEMDVRRSMTALCYFGIGGMFGVWITTHALVFI